MSNDVPEYLLWFDFETTGLDRWTDVPIELAAVVTTASDLVEIDGYETLIWADPVRVEGCAARDMHAASGLLAAWQDAVNGLRRHDPRAPMQLIHMADALLCQMLDSLAIPIVTLAGSGVGTFDLPLIRATMPALSTRLTYHVHDVGVMRRAYRRATGHDLTERTEPAHRAMADVQQSLTEGRAFAELFRASSKAAW